MLRTLVQVILVVVILVAAAAFFTGYRWGGGQNRPTTTEPAARQTAPIGTAGDQNETSRERARAAGAEVGEKVAVGAQRAGEALDDVGLTAKVKSKIALDDTLKGSDIHVTTEDKRVTLTGTVINEAQRRRASDLARETAGVSNVIDHLSVGATASP